MATAQCTLFERERGVTEVAVRSDLAHIAIHCDADGRLAALRALADGQVPIFLLKLSDNGFSCVVRRANVERAVEILSGAGDPFERTENVALVSTIAGTMRDLSGVIARICDAMIEVDVRVLQTGDAYDAVHCLVAASAAERAADALRRAFGISAEVES